MKKYIHQNKGKNDVCFSTRSRIWRWKNSTVWTNKRRSCFSFFISMTKCSVNIYFSWIRPQVCEVTNNRRASFLLASLKNPIELGRRFVKRIIKKQACFWRARLITSTKIWSEICEVTNNRRAGILLAVWTCKMTLNMQACFLWRSPKTPSKSKRLDEFCE